ncbi:Tfp pilus assembly protein PilF [Zhouia amylolytica]|uniref:Tfp pilus assembly protein PilF n=1 Tax=Zhouia amylolytica TaxID=376730 RepID=A0A1I6SCC1_9FLAO|nr:tetratricopeptide repeat protein [Zhouia amylolytica]SFS74584.1 Tfp pilus assembly protein PilF [Zhouia amylolytica]
MLSKIGLTFSFLLLLLLSACKKDAYINVKESDHVAVNAEFVGDQACISCHQKEYDSWKGSHHDQAMKVADSVSVLGNFNNIAFEYNGGKANFFKKGSDYYVQITGPDNLIHDYKVKYTFGVTPLQQYIVALDNGKFQCLTIAWDSVKNKWFNLYPDLTIATDEWIHWTGGGMRWNTACADCHSTDLHKNYNPNTDVYKTSFKQINVSCEACHGPAADHVNFYKQGLAKESPQKLFMNGDESSVELVDRCARCHSRRTQLTKDYKHHEGFKDHYLEALLTPPLYEGDGQINDEVYVYGSFKQSKMYHNGISCKDCHDVHSLKLKKQGNALCLSCHEPKYNSEAHHNHANGTPGSECINCHMTGKVYMGNDFRRDHSFRIPRPDQSVAYGTPNACNSCHNDKSAEWAVNALHSWGTDKAMSDKAHFSDYLLAGYSGNKEAFYYLLNNPAFPEIARATALRNYTNMSLSEAEVKQLKKFLSDSSALVRNEAVVSYTKFGDTSVVNTIEKLLNDTVRVVRISSAKFIGVYGHERVNSQKFESAHKEFLAFLEMNSDFSTGQEQIAEYKYLKNEVEDAIEAYERAIQLDNYNNNARVNLAFLYYQNGAAKKAARLYAKIIEQEPENSYPYYMLGLLFNELGKNDAALKYLAQACEREPFNLRAFYNYALKLQQQGNYTHSMEVIDEALQHAPENADLLYVKAIGALELKQIGLARTIAQKLVASFPNQPGYANLLQEIEKRAEKIMLK